MVNLENRKRARLMLEDGSLDGNSDSHRIPIVSSSNVSKDMTVTDYPSAPKAFLCPLTLEIMFDPVLDAEGNTFERHAILKWLNERRISPISRQPLHKTMLIANIALREVIHDYMGEEWVERKNRQHHAWKQAQQNADAPPQACRYRAKIDGYLQGIDAHDFGGLKLRLNEQGCAAFRYDDIIIVIDVPENVGVFCVYTRELIGNATESMKDCILELNFLQGETRGGCLSIKKHDNGRSEVMFSYNDRVTEVSVREFRNILLNFVETAVSLRHKLQPKTATDASTTDDCRLQTTAGASYC